MLSPQFVASAAFCGELVVSGGGDGALRLWDVAGTALDSAQLGAAMAEEGGEAEKEGGEGEKEGGEGEKEGGEGQGAAAADEPGGRFQAVVALAARRDGALVAALVEGRSEVQLLGVDAAARELQPPQTLSLPEVSAAGAAHPPTAFPNSFPPPIPIPAASLRRLPHMADRSWW